MSSCSPRNPRTAGASILVVDDDVLMVRLVEQTLGAEGYTVWTATRAADARKLLDELAGAVELVLTDVAMPGGHGSELAAEIRFVQPVGARALHVQIFS